MLFIYRFSSLLYESPTKIRNWEWQCSNLISFCVTFCLSSPGVIIASLVGNSCNHLHIDFSSFYLAHVIKLFKLILWGRVEARIFLSVDKWKLLWPCIYLFCVCDPRNSPSWYSSLFHWHAMLLLSLTWHQLLKMEYISILPV